MRCTSPLSFSDMTATVPFEEGDPEPHDSLELHIDIYSEELSPDQLTDYLGVAPDSVHVLGALRTRPNLAADAPDELKRWSDSLWSIHSHRERSASDEEHLADLWARASLALSRVAGLSRTVRVFLRYNHVMDGRSFQGHGLSLSAEWVQLLAGAGAVVDIDQYVTLEAVERLPNTLDAGCSCDSSRWLWQDFGNI